MIENIKIEINLEVTECNRCGVRFAIPETMLESLRKNAQIFYCPNGHSLWFGISEEDKLKKALKEEKRQKELYQNWYKAEQDDHEHTRRQLSATKGVLTKTKKRIANGVCPCCRRHFTNLQRHIETRHPDYSGEGEDR